ncbi:MAG: EamA family transporter [Candidatus Aenigmarchaeota archaeon]|nr:EamA family transporter [Candidatus Aenigmarchaeota archaeon]
MVTELQIALISGILSMLGWGLADFFAKKTVDRIGDLRTLFWSQIFGLVPILIYLFLNFKLPHLTLRLVLHFILVSFFGSFGILLFYRGLSKGKASVITPIYSSYAAFAVFISFLIFHEVIIGLTWLGLGSIFFGIILASFDYGEIKEVDFELKDLSKGVLETLIAAIIMGLYFPFWNSFLSDTGWPVFLLLNNFVICITVLIISLFKKFTLRIKGRNLWVWLLIVGVFTSGAFLTLVWGFNKTDFTSIISILSAASPVVVIILARIFLKERMSLTQKLGVVLVLLGLIIISI